MPSAKPVWGLDIGASAIKGVRMRADGDRVRILAADIMPLGGTPPTDETLGRDRRIWRGLQRFQAKHGVTSDRVAVALPGTVFFTRPFKLLRVGNRSEAEVVRFEIEQHIPFGLDAILWDYEIFDQDESLGREREGLLFAMKKEVLNNYFLSFSAGGIEPMQIQSAPLALYHFMRYELDPQDPILVADIGAATTNLLAMDGRRYWMRAINRGGDMVTAALQEAFRPRPLSREQAEAIKVSLPKLTRRAEVVEQIRPRMRGFVGELRNAMGHLAREHGLTFRRIVVVGGDSGMYGLSGLMAEQLGMRVVTPAGLGRIEVNDAADPAYVNANLPSLAPAIGMGLQALGKPATRVNLVGATLLRRRSQTLVRRIAATVLVTIALGVACLGGFASWRKAVVAHGAQAMRDVLDPLAVRRRNFVRFTRPGEAERRLEAMRRLAEDRGTWLRVLDTVARILPDNSKPGLPPEQKLWLIQLSLSADPGRRGVYDGVIEAGTLLQPDGSHVRHARRVLRSPLEAAEGGVFKNIKEVASDRSPTLSFSGGTGPDKYYVLQLEFQVVPTQGGGE